MPNYGFQCHSHNGGTLELPQPSILTSLDSKHDETQAGLEIHGLYGVLMSGTYFSAALLSRQKVRSMMLLFTIVKHYVCPYRPK
jgi:hypothetical protein